MLLWVFPPCLSNRKLMWSSTEDREKAFSFHCESFEREKKNEKKEEGEKSEQASALIQPLCSLGCFSLVLASPHSSFSIPYALFQLFFLTLLFYSQFFWCRVDSSILEGNGGFMESSRVLWEDGEGWERKGETKSKWSQALWGAVQVLPVQFQHTHSKKRLPALCT